jgi:hypothetical protein
MMRSLKAHVKNGRLTLDEPTDRSEGEVIELVPLEDVLADGGDGLLHSLKNPHPEAAELADIGLAAWAASLPAEDEGLVDVTAGKPVRWIEERGWVEGSE